MLVVKGLGLDLVRSHETHLSHLCSAGDEGGAETVEVKSLERSTRGVRLQLVLTELTILLESSSLLVLSTLLQARESSAMPGW